MNQPSHMVNRLLMTVELDTQDRVGRLQARFEAFCRERLPVLLDTALAPFSTPLLSRVLAHIELDIGTVPEREMEEVLAERIAKALAEHLIRLLGLPLFPSAAERDVLTSQRLLMTLAEYLSKGATQQFAIDRLMQAALVAEPADAVTLLRKIGRNPAVRRRLATALRATTIAQVVQVLRPSDAAVIIEYAQHIQIQQQRTQTKQLIAVREEDFNHVLWEVIFAYLLADRGSQFNRYTFIDSILRQIAARYGLSYLQLLEGLLSQVEQPTMDTGREESLLTILFRLRSKALMTGDAQTVPPVITSGKTPNASRSPAVLTRPSTFNQQEQTLGVSPAAAALTVETSQRWLCALAMFLEHGVLPWFTLHGAGTAHALLNSLIEKSPHILAPWLQTVLGHAAARNRLASQFPIALRGKILRLLAPDQAEAILQWLAPLTPLLHYCIERSRQRLARSSTTSVAWLIEGLWLAIFDFLAQPHQARSTRNDWLRALLQHAAAQNGLVYSSLLANLLLESKSRTSLAALAHDLHAALLSLHTETVLERARLSEIKRRFTLLSGATAPAYWALRGSTLFSRPKRFALHPKEVSRSYPSLQKVENSAYCCLLWLKQGIWPIASAFQDSVAQTKNSRRNGGREKNAINYDLPNLYCWLNALLDSEWQWALQCLKTNEHTAALQRIMSVPTALRLRVFRLLVSTHDAQVAFEFMHTLHRAMHTLGLGTSALKETQTTLLSVMLNASPGTPFVQIMQTSMQLLAVHYAIPLRQWFEALYSQNKTSKEVRWLSLYRLLKQIQTEQIQAEQVQQAQVLIQKNLHSKNTVQIASLSQSIESRSLALKAIDKLDQQITPATSVSALEGLCYFLDHGVLPEGEVWRSFNSAKWFDLAFTQDKNAALNALRARASEPDGLRRLWACMPRNALIRLIEWLVPQHAQAIISLLLAGEALQYDSTLSGRQQARTGQLHWQVALANLLNPHAPTFSLKVFVDQLNTQVAQRLGLSLVIYTQRLFIATQQYRVSEDGDRSLLALLKAKLPASELVKGRADSPENLPTNYLKGRQSREDGAEQPELTQIYEDGESHLGFDNKADHRLLDNVGRGSQIASTPLPPSSLDMLDAFLRFGQWPVDGLATLTEAVKRLYTASPALLRRRIRIAIGDALERTRLAWLLPWHSFMVWLGWLWPVHYGAIKEIIEGLTQIAQQADGRTDFWRSTLIETLLAALNTGDIQRRRWHDLLDKLIRQLIHTQSLAPAMVLATLRVQFAQASARTILLAALDWIELTLALEIEPNPVRAGKTLRKKPLSNARTLPSLQASSSEKESKITKANKPNKASLPAEEPFYIQNAGLILLWPFLSRYFQILELVEGKNFRDPAAQCRAIYLLQYLVTGSLEATEPELLLNKILCGALDAHPSDLAIAKHLPLTEREIAISEEVLYGVIGNWEKLRNTSITGLQTSFLLRDGKLEKRKDDAWTLAVSLRAYDVLLDTLPWGLSTIRLPWMQNVLHVKWK